MENQDYMTKEQYRKKIVSEFPEFIQSLIYSYDPFVGKMKTPERLLLTFADCKQKGYSDASFLMETTGKVVVRFLYAKKAAIASRDVSPKIVSINKQLQRLVAENALKWEESHEYGVYSSWWDLTIEEENWNEDVFHELWSLVSKYEKLTMCPRSKCENSVCKFCE